MRFLETGEAPAQGNLELPVVAERKAKAPKQAATAKKLPARNKAPAKKKPAPAKKKAREAAVQEGGARQEGVAEEACRSQAGQARQVEGQGAQAQVPGKDRKEAPIKNPP